MKRVLIAITTIGVLGSAYFGFSPYLAVRGLRIALENGDRIELQERVDFPRIREGLKEQFGATMAEATMASANDGPFGAFAMAVAGKFMDGMIDAVVTPTGLARIAAGEPPTPPDSSVPTRGLKPPFADATIDRETFDRFSVWAGEEGSKGTRFVFRRRGLRWVLTDLQLALPARGEVEASPASEDVRRKTAKLQIANLATALDAMAFDTGRYPNAQDGLSSLLDPPSGMEKWDGPYLKKLPKDPWNHDYVYRSPSGDNDYEVLSYGADGSPGGEGGNADLSSND